ncbi:hypothetical protein A674_04713 [Salmonella enterica subsp. enterica serovar Enteritidis str. 2009K1651]|uniref:Uncharacterized protein n=1 Tax=Salmonella paratyphi B (strain ATCC BAA-1250 / SPB7) TaxID=1016998 RepID=A0A6C6YZJ2_SALPB|nr:hypothetical protein SPAB_01322 [Salmonella enterica subsp. enterica serovar Paratyphi B str. SPB7]EPI64967.1 hypothetical protein A672_04369 [Salmonella enterica subsp. enterica serovar Enteritidis str. 08-1080]EPI78211.1 hypothetical protein A674_04713 [Salmonella enterica subsp. enterica serovar Enteritidis str. 2009K1651]EPI78433.1 hypothetical protein A675_04900 [Salmonella enterica subsp. enterica serovar Enteritidis str. 2009K1726]EPI92037.1 hypothetical protein A677_05064 [Salmonella
MRFVAVHLLRKYSSPTGGFTFDCPASHVRDNAGRIRYSQ